MRTFYTERDIVDMHRAGVTEIEVSDDIILTDLAREKANDLGLSLKTVDFAGPPLPATPAPAPAPSTSSPASQQAPLSDEEIVARVKARVIARLGTTEYNDLLSQIIPQVLARLTKEKDE